jgi:hypothetical protein
MLQAIVVAMNGINAPNFVACLEFAHRFFPVGSTFTKKSELTNALGSSLSSIIPRGRTFSPRL